jgi:hypothetical protein
MWDAHNCSDAAESALYATFAHVMNGDIATWVHISFLFMGVGLVAETVLVAWLRRFPQALGTQPARQ